MVVQPGANEIRAESVPPECDFALAPTIGVDQRAPSPPNDADIIGERTPLPEAAAQMLSDFGRGLRSDSNEPLASELEAGVPKTVFQNDDPALISGELQASDEPVSTGRAATPTGPRRLWWVILLLGGFIAIALSVYFYKKQSAQLAANPVLNQPSHLIAGAAPIVSPLPETDVEVKPSRNQHAVKECPEAVEVLGLCRPDTKKE
jgi:hypothetical protein